MPITYPFAMARSVVLPAGVTNADVILEEKGTFGDHTAAIVRFVPVEPPVLAGLTTTVELPFKIDFNDEVQVRETFLPWCTTDEGCTKWLCLVDPKQCP